MHTAPDHSLLNTPCPCANGLTYARCCRVAHLHHAVVTSAERLMRSRYSAFVFKRAEYLLQTWHVSTRPRHLNLDDDPTQWLRLEIINCQAGGEGDRHGKVEFKAYYQWENGVACLHEISRFRRENDKWFYLDGKIKPA
jgi:SEC-C motif domain protein